MLEVGSAAQNSEAVCMSDLQNFDLSFKHQVVLPATVKCFCSSNRGGGK